MEADRRAGLAALLLGGLWLAGARLAAEHGVHLLPRALAARLTLHSYLGIVLVIATGAALLAARAFGQQGALAARAPRPAAAAAALLAAPVVSVLSAWAGYRIALPTLLAELAQGGRQAVEKNTGAFGRALVETHPATTLVWAVVLTPIAEELIFRGALWSGITRLSAGLAPAAERSLPPELLNEPWPLRFARRARQRLAGGGAATLLTAGLFAWLHADQPGGAGIVRVVQTGCLGLALGVARHQSGSILPGMLLHAVFNLMAIAKLRRWVVSPGWPPPLPIATLYWQIAAGCALALAALAAAQRLRKRAR